MSNGIMTQQWTVWCGSCTAWDQLSGKKSHCSKDFKKTGWKKIQGSWTCPSCQEKIKKESP